MSKWDPMYWFILLLYALRAVYSSGLETRGSCHSTRPGLGRDRFSSEKAGKHWSRTPYGPYNLNRWLTTWPGLPRSLFFCKLQPVQPVAAHDSCGIRSTWDQLSVRADFKLSQRIKKIWRTECVREPCQLVINFKLCVMVVALFVCLLGV